MIELKNVSFTYQTRDHNAGVYDINLEIPSGQVVLFCGASGCGKTTITRLINKLVPTYYPGDLKGEIFIDKVNCANVSLFELSKKIGSVFQNPRSQFFSVDSTGEIAFGCENTGVPRQEIYKRIGQVTKDLDMEYLLDRNLFALSGGEKQKIACASIAAMEPDIFILDEPSSNLDLHTIYDLKEVIGKWKNQGKTVIIAEHRLYYLMELVDRIIYMKEGRVDCDLSTEEFRKIEESKLHEMGLRSREPVYFAVSESKSYTDEELSFKDLSFSYNKNKFLDIPKLNVPTGRIIGILGYNGAGKSTFAMSICGLEKNTKGIMNYRGKIITAKDWRRISYMVMQDVNHQLFTESVLDELLLSMDKDDESAKNRAIEILKKLNLEKLQDLHPMSLFGGQKQRVAIGSAIAGNKEVLIFDEPTSGLDYRNMLEVSKIMKKLSNEGRTLFIITHDPELLKECCDYVIFLKDGKILWNGNWNRDVTEKVNAFFNASF